MAVTVRHLYRHPVKSLGEEPLETVTLQTGRHMPWDRVWAIAHGAGAWDPEAPEWMHRRNFVNQAHMPTLAQTSVAFDEKAGRLRLAHPDRPGIEIEPGTDEGAERLTGWIAPLAEDRRPGPYRLARLPDTAFTDFPETHLLICNLASLAELEEMAGCPLEHVRFRANIWLDGLAPWTELEMPGRELAIGDVRLGLLERCERCAATAANPETGQADVQVPALLRRRFGHMDFGIYARVVHGGRISRGDRVAL